MNRPQELNDKRSFFYNRIYVIESLNENEKATGKTLFEDLLTREAHRTPGLSVSYKYCSSKKELFAYLVRIKADASTGQVMPFIHFECHGSKAGVLLESGEKVHWNEFVYYFTDINILVKNNLFISFTVCCAFYIYSDIAGCITERAPFFWLH
jgi:hypothetical protein